MSLLIVVVGVVGACLAAWHWRVGVLGYSPWASGLGSGLMATGIAIRQWAIFVLGRFFTADVRVHTQQAVVDHGPYRSVRHPSYSGMIVFFVGLGLALANWLSLVVLALVPTVGLIVRIRSEERTLLAGLGESYRRYAATGASSQVSGESLQGPSTAPKPARISSTRPSRIAGFGTRFWRRPIGLRRPDKVPITPSVRAKRVSRAGRSVRGDSVWNRGWARCRYERRENCRLGRQRCHRGEHGFEFCLVGTFEAGSVGYLSQRLDEQVEHRPRGGG
jgi:protein-S-isoprenylcysteine O-methyltransferase Ste14